MSTETWELPTSSVAIFPKAESDQLEKEENYYVWSVQMWNSFESCEVMGIVDVSKTCPPDDTTNTVKNHTWKKKDSLAKPMIMQCMKADLIIKVAHIKHAKESWDVFVLSSVRPAQGQLCYGSGDWPSNSPLVVMSLQMMCCSGLAVQSGSSANLVNLKPDQGSVQGNGLNLGPNLPWTKLEVQFRFWSGSNLEPHPKVNKIWNKYWTWFYTKPAVPLVPQVHTAP